MKAYSIDLRSRIVKTYEVEEISPPDLAKRFCVAPSFVQKMQKILKQHGETGNLEAKAHQKKPEYEWMKNYPSTVYQSAFMDLKKAFDRWRKGGSGFPQKKSKKKGDSFTLYLSLVFIQRKVSQHYLLLTELSLKQLRELSFLG